MITVLESVLAELPGLAIAVSGGVDSMTLAHAAHRAGVSGLRVIHALSPAVPAEATARVRDHANRHSWRLQEVDAGEFGDADYRANPVNRCYFCKNNLYGRIAGLTEGPIASGTNLDDLGDFRPGLQAAAEHRVRHPFVEARMDKAAVRTLAHAFGLEDIAELPAQPCLSSRIETGIPISADDLGFVARMEQALSPLAPPGTDLRCRVTHTGIVVEAGDPTAAMRQAASELCRLAARPLLGFRPYRRGSAFLRGTR
jgi:pyridinium-3,5-biscarboxylic acid mononucleotide sulfurtransferase